MKPKNILLVSVRADFGGGPKHIDILIKNLDPSYNLYLACPDDKPFYEEWQRLKQVKGIITIPHRKFNLKAFFNFINFCKQYHIDIVHSHGKGAGIYSRLLKVFLPKVEIIHTFHGIHIGEYSNFKKEVYFTIERILTRLTDKFINVSVGEKNICLQNKLFKSTKSKVIYNAIALEPQITTPRPIHLADKFVVTTVSRFDFPKNMWLAYEIASRLKNHRNIVFLWVGDGDDKAALVESVAKEGFNNIFFTGFSNNVNQYLTWSDIYLSTSKWEALPYALIEAASLKVPIVATDVVGNNEIVSHGENGLLFGMNEIDKAVDYIKLLSENKDIHQKMSDNVYQSFLTNFQIKSTVVKLECVYNDLGD
jgi:glycosyltransferase involved in cell wall biosynthesis